MNGQDDFTSAAPPPQPPDSAPGALSRKDWIITLALQAIPCIGFIFSLVWAFSEGNADRKKFARAWLIINICVGIIIGVLVVIFAAFIWDVLQDPFFSYGY
ncbi:MAG: hypothetical protein LBT59_02980 [Clostridiales bacterium]|jgi:hypothetical protein|nr:hypothetical protein [Clostridiales bacterium]